MQGKITKNIIFTGLATFFLFMVFQNLVKAYFENEYLFLGYLWGAVFIICLFILNLVKKTEIKVTTLDWIIFAYIIVQALYMIPSLSQFPRGAIMGFMYNVRNFFFPYFLIRLAIPSKDESRWLIRIIAFLIFLVAAYGVYQFFFDWERLLQVSPQIWGYFYSAGKRAYSILLTPLDLAYSSMVMGIFALAYMFSRDKVLGWSSKAVYFLVFAACLFLTFTRSAYLGIGTGIITLIILYLLRIGFSWKLLLMIIIVILLIFGIFWWQFPDLVDRVVRLDDPSAVFHLKNFGEGLKVFFRNPLGIGLGRSGWTVTKWGAGEGIFFESTLLQIMVETGIPGAGLFLVILFKVLLISITGYFKSGKGIFLGLSGATVGLFIGSFFLPVFYFSTVMSLYWGMVAIAFVYYNQESNET